MDVVLVHGLAGSSRWWAKILPALAERHAVHAVDLPRLWPGLDPVAWLERRIRELERPALVGHSLGGLVCAAAATRTPGHVRAAAFLAPAGLPLGRSLPAFGLPLAHALHLAGPRFLPRITADALRAGPLSLLLGARLALRADLARDLARLDAPVLLVWGDRDALVARAVGEQWLRALPRARLVTLRGAGHVPMVERPRELAAVLLDFLEEVERQPR